MLKSHLKQFSIAAIFLIVSNQLFSSEIKVNSKVIITKDIKHDVSIPLRYIQGSVDKFNSSKMLQQILNEKSSALNFIQSTLVPLKGFQGIGIGLGTYQVMHETPNLSGSVGMTQYVQWASNDIAVFDKTTGQVAIGFPKPGNSIWSGFGGGCENSNIGQFSVKYDQIAHRWIVNQFAYDDVMNGPFYQCVAVSTSEDATGSYNRYSFTLDSYADHAKIGVWHDAYYLSHNLIGPAYTGPQVCALDRAKMIQGQPSTMQCFKLANTLPTSHLYPADLDGLVPAPIGNPAYYLSLNEPSNLIIAKFYVDFVTPANSKIVAASTPVNNFTRACPATAGKKCAIQPQTTNRLNVYSDRIVSRVAYRQFQDYGSIVLTHTVAGPAPKYSPAIRWYELRVFTDAPNANPVVYQGSTFAPDSKHRYTGSIAIDRYTNIAIGYTVSSSLGFPSPELSYHNYTDQLNEMTLQPLVTSLGSQVNDVTDWGTSSSMAVDPVDECTFWHSGEYLKTTGSLNWSTYILKFKLDSCV